MPLNRSRPQGNFLFGGMAAFGIAWLLWACVCLAGAGALVYVAWHFISKFW